MNSMKQLVCILQECERACEKKINKGIRVERVSLRIR